MASVAATAATTNYYKVSTEPDAWVSNDGGVWSAQTAVGDAVAATMVDANGVPTNTVVLNTSFDNLQFAGLNVAASQNLALVHEALHTGTQLNEFQLAAKLGLGTFDNTLEGLKAASLSISLYLRYDCPPGQ
jgi:hypothetical protein